MGLMKTVDFSRTTPVISPVERSAVPVTLPGSGSNLLTTHTGVPAARRGSGAPKNSPFWVPGPVAPSRTQVASETVSQPVTSEKIIEFPVTMKLCERPIHPLSRSLPTPPSGAIMEMCAGVGSVVVVVVVLVVAQLCEAPLHASAQLVKAPQALPLHLDAFTTLQVVFVSRLLRLLQGTKPARPQLELPVASFVVFSQALVK